MRHLHGVIVSLLWVFLCQVACAQGVGREIHFSGVLSQQGRSGDGQILRRFEAILLQLPSGPFFAVLDHERDGCPWPESFGRLADPSGPIPHLIYTYEDSPYTLPLPALQLTIPDSADVGAEWSSDGWTFELLERRDGAASEPAWLVSAKESRGRKQLLQVSVETGTLLEAKQDVFMGQGDRFELTLKQSSANALGNAEAIVKLASALTELQAGLKRRPDSQLAELSPRQVSDAVVRMPALSEMAKETPLQELVYRVQRNLDQQQQRVAQTMKRQSELLDRSAPEFSLNLISGGHLASDALHGKVVILHFWPYTEKPLSEPYGQVGYLDFLYNKRKQLNVSVVGVATNAALREADQIASARLSARKLIEFMNLSYPIGFDDGSLLRELGDPRMSGGELPLWVVLSPAGKIVHYHSGFYEIDRERGLLELDEILTKTLVPAADQ